jgi:hypothetical protein
MSQTCSFHKTDQCMSNGFLTLWLHVAGDPDSFAGFEEQGVFCTIHSLYSWLEHQGAMKGRPGDLGAKRTRPAHPENRPTVPQRRPRQSLAPGGPS